MFDALRRRSVLAAVLTIAWATALAAQIRIVSPTYPTPSPNPSAQRFDPAAALWRTHETEHFDIFHPSPADLTAIVAEAERAYSRVSYLLQQNLTHKIPLIVVPRTTDLPRNVQEATALVRASGAPDIDHLLLPLEPRAERAALLHELTHIFQFAVDPDNRWPRWVSEGLADHVANTWAEADLSRIRAAAAAGTIPSAAKLVDSDRIWGHAVFDFVNAEHGAQGLRRYVEALRTRPELASPHAVFGVTAAEFDAAFRAYINVRLIERTSAVQ